MSRRSPQIDWSKLTVWTLAALYCLAMLGLAGLGAAYLAGWVS